MPHLAPCIKLVRDADALHLAMSASQVLQEMRWCALEAAVVVALGHQVQSRNGSRKCRTCDPHTWANSCHPPKVFTEHFRTSFMFLLVSGSLSACVFLAHIHRRKPS
jgi:hypothetical protein